LAQSLPLRYVKSGCNACSVYNNGNGIWTKVRHEGAKEVLWYRHFQSSHAAQEMREWPLEAGLQEQASNRLKLLS